MSKYVVQEFFGCAVLSLYSYHIDYFFSEMNLIRSYMQVSYMVYIGPAFWCNINKNISKQ